MITTTRGVLIINEEQQLQDISYEAIEIITDPAEIESIWRKNKTPLMLRKYVTPKVTENYEVFELPRHIFGPEHFISFCHELGIESGEFCSNEKYDTSKEECFLCDIASHMGIKGKTYMYNQQTKRVNDIIIYESENFFVKIEWGCLKKGMLMICPNKHVLSAARIPEQYMEEYEQVKQDVEFLLKSVYGDEPVIFFEHGASPTGFSGHQRSVVHAHTHVAWGIRFEQKYLDMVCLVPVKNIKELYDKKYFSYQEGSNGELLAVGNPEVYVQRQYPRQVIGFMLGIPNEKTNWRKEGFYDNVIETFEDIYRYLEKNQSFLCERLQKRTECFVEGYKYRAERPI